MSFTSSTARAAAAGTFLVLSLAACGPRPPDQFFIPACEAMPSWLIDPQAALVSPASGATGVPVTVGTVSFTVTDPALKQGATFKLQSFDPDITTTQIATANGVMSVTIPTLKPHFSYQAMVTAPLPADRQTECKSQMAGFLGSFTTQ
jgi:hypothetical protein